MMGGDGSIDKNNVALTEIHFSAISEIMNQMIGSSATALSNLIGTSINITPPEAQNIEVGRGIGDLMEGYPLLIRISFDMEIEGVLHSKLLQMMPLKLAKELADTQLHPAPEPAPKPAPISSPKTAAAAQKSVAPKPASMNAQSNSGTLDLLSGNTDDLAGLMIDAKKSEIAVNLTVAIRNKAMDAYKEVMNMQV